ncbi:hypothetical protein H5410_006999 [Solanum commersonii]|uniref:Uncharacterized protein n=1 Tax=Solanum commersonii TaxID=4109 RepID=A0A9J6AAW4_SOLCO|nr:hypothetical protein H5410_006999 [Solanum commersonii]
MARDSSMGGIYLINNRIKAVYGWHKGETLEAKLEEAQRKECKYKDAVIHIKKEILKEYNS